MRLEEAQREFIRYLYAPKPDEGRQRAVRELFLSDERPDPGNGLKTYRRNLLFGMLQALRDTYGFCRALLGENNFNFLGREYIYSHPSHGTDLTAYGGEFGDFLERRPEVGTWPFLADVARLEWARDRAFYSPGEESLTAKVPFRLKASITLLESPYDLLGAFELFQKGGLEALPRDPFGKGPRSILVFAQAGEPRQEVLDPSTAALLRELPRRPLPADPGSFPAAWEALAPRGWLTQA